jgi:aspartate 1-decarboxylase
MRKFLGEEPSIDIDYKNDVLIDEIVGEAKSIKSLEKVSIVFFDTDDRFKKLEFLID